MKRALVIGLSLAMACVAHASDVVTWQGREARMQASGHGFVLHSPAGERQIGAQPWTVHTASVMFDGLFAMAQDDLKRDSVDAIRDGAFDDGQPIPCACFETGEKWHYVWTRDLSYAVDLGLWRADPARARASLRFKTSDVRAPGTQQGLYVMQDTGSGGSWPISSDRIVWFLAARHLLDDKAFAADTYRALQDTLAQDRDYLFDAQLGLYRGETSFLDWRQQTYPMWAAKDVTFIGQSFALSTNVLHYQALTLAATMATKANELAKAAMYAGQAAALKQAINMRFWRADRGMYASYLGGIDAPRSYDTYDLLGIALAVTTGVAEGDRARQTLANYPAWPSGSPVIWPERADVPIYHNRAIWPFVSAYALRAARQVNDPTRIAHELQSLMRGAALAGSNMENFELVTQSTHVDDGDKSGPVVDSPRQLWSVGAYVNVVLEGVFGLEADGRIAPKLPASLLPELFGTTDRIRLDLGDRSIVLVRPASVKGNLLVAAEQQRRGREITVTLKATQVPASVLRSAPLYAEHPDPAFQARPTAVGEKDRAKLCDKDCASGDATWSAPASGRYLLSALYNNDHGTIETGITAAVYHVDVSCDGKPLQRTVMVMPHSEGQQRSTYGSFEAAKGASCRITLHPGFNMSYLSRFAHYTGGQGGASGPLNEAHIDSLWAQPQHEEHGQ